LRILLKLFLVVACASGKAGTVEASPEKGHRYDRPTALPIYIQITFAPVKK
jgi:hypothetical protein